MVLDPLQWSSATNIQREHTLYFEAKYHWIQARYPGPLNLSRPLCHLSYCALMRYNLPEEDIVKDIGSTAYVYDITHRNFNFYIRQLKATDDKEQPFNIRPWWLVGRVLDNVHTS